MRRFIILVVVATVAAPVAAGATTDRLPDHAAEKVAAAHARAVSVAQDFAAEKARGLDLNKTTGLERAAEVSNSWRFTGAEKPGNGNGRALGVGRADAVHAALANGQSPSSLDSHGEAVSAAAREMSEAFKGLKQKADGHPGKGQGKDLGGPGGDDD